MMSHQTNHFSRPLANQNEENYLRTVILDAHAQLQRKEITGIRVYDSNDEKNTKTFAPISKVMVFKLTPDGHDVFEKAQKEFEESRKTTAHKPSNHKKRIRKAQNDLGSAISIFNQGNLAEEYRAAIEVRRFRSRNNWKRNP